MKKSHNIIGKLIYALLFLAVLPLILVFWAQRTEDIITYPSYQSIEGGWGIALFGIVFMAWGMWALMVHGEGLPMNAFPPNKLVSMGPFRLSRNPVYWGFGLLVAGYFVAYGSPSGLWLVTPIVILSMMALIVGYEIIDLRKRFPNQSFKTFFDFPPRNAEGPGLKVRIVVLTWLLPFLLLSNGVILYLTSDSLPITGNSFTLGGLSEYPQIQLFTFICVGAFPFLIKTNALLRDWLISTLLALILTAYLALLWPPAGAQYLLHNDWGTIAMPISIILISFYTYLRQSGKFPLITGMVTFIIVFIQLSCSRSSILHGITAIAIFLLSAYYYNFWILLRNGSEYIANSWKEWRFGKIRIINHGFYVGFGSFIGILLASYLAGAGYGWTILMFAVIVIIFSGVWAQLIEGSEKLKRPFGFYGAMVGIVFASLAVWTTGKSVWITIGAITVVMPWVQAIGRMRCLINGCCHGVNTHDDRLGIRYYHFRSRVCGISNMKGESLHPTPLYSILWLVLIGFVLLALWNNGFVPSFIFGMYLMLTGIGRFVEEAYRGEVQTPVIKGLRLYQWIAILSLIIGMVMTTITIEIPVSYAGLTPEAFVASIIGGLFTFFAMGVDFPYSNARFSRLV